jgi:transcription antitermination factor NusG
MREVRESSRPSTADPEIGSARAVPETQLPAPATLPDVARWAAVHTRPRCEWRVLAGLEREGIPSFLPAFRKRHTYGARVRVSTLPLFNGYLFYDFDAVDRVRVLRSYGVVRVVETKDPERLSVELQSLAQALAVDGATPRRVALGPPGTPVEIVAGPFAGCRGELVKTASRASLVMRVDFLGFGAEVEIDEAFVRTLLTGTSSKPRLEAPLL